MAAVARLRQNYAATFARFLINRDEGALAAAYELGRSALADGVGLLDVVLIHHHVVIEALPASETHRNSPTRRRTSSWRSWPPSR